jgi:hypothetical protein
MPAWHSLVLCVGHGDSTEMVEANVQWTSLVSELGAGSCYLKEEVLIK